MVQKTLISTALFAWLANAAQAGFYDVQKPTSPLVTDDDITPLPYNDLLDELNSIRNLAATSTPGLSAVGPNLPRKKLLDQRDRLLSKGLRSLNATELAELGYMQWRLGDREAATATLLQASAKDPRNFWALAQYGTALQAQRQYADATDKLIIANDYFPSPWPAGPKRTGEWFKQAEKYQLRLLRLRMSEGGERGMGRPGRVNDVDNLFGVRFVGPSGKYEPGALADEERKKLPPDAIAIVQQLLLWFPDDARLLWLLGELYAANGQLEAAYRILDNCVWTQKFESVALREHRKLVQEAHEARIAAAAAQAAASPASAPSILPDAWHLWAVGSVFGIILLALGYYQLRELLRRL